MNENEIRNLVAEVKQGTLSRRSFIGTLAAVGIAAPIASQILAWHDVAMANATLPYKPTKAGGGGVFNSMYNSVRRLSTAEAAAIKPRRIDVVTVARGDTVATMARRMAYSSYQTERFQVLNRLTADSRLTPGQKVKIVVYASR